MQASSGTASILAVLFRSATVVMAMNWASLAYAGDSPEYDEIKRLIGDAACQEDSQCRTIAIGRNACGGPSAFLAWSSLLTNEKKLQKAVAALGRQGKRVSGPGLDHSTCEVLTDPGARCIKPPGANVGTCRLNAQTDGLPDR